MRQPESVGSRFLRPGGEDGRNDADLAVGGALGCAAGSPSRHALRSQSTGSGGSASRSVIGRSLVAGLCLLNLIVPFVSSGVR